ncbi:MAG: hypothetical protein IJ223_03715 [Clostridia bacterium]|nr:hypothetical protein [Clostridia bacterium]
MMWNTVLLILGALITMGGVVLVYDARSLTARVFGFGDQNEATLGMKMIGFAISIIGALMIYFFK